MHAQLPARKRGVTGAFPAVVRRICLPRPGSVLPVQSCGHASAVDDHDRFPCFLDVEASGFGPESYPIEIAWSLPDGSITRSLIAPQTVPSWTYWDPQAEQVHGIDRDRLRRNGWKPEVVVQRLRDDLAGRTVYTDAPTFDADWLRRLFSAVAASSVSGAEALPFAVENVDELVLMDLRRPGEAIWQAMVRLDGIKADLNAVREGKHSAGYDVGYLLALWRQAHGESIKMHHGIGPLPMTTATGTFVRVKK